MKLFNSSDAWTATGAGTLRGLSPHRDGALPRKVTKRRREDPRRSFGTVPRWIYGTLLTYQLGSTRNIT